jgi:hypothetical protein
MGVEAQGRERGQAAVETAIVLPLMIFIVLGILQLSMMQHARIMTEYAAFNAARAGIVWNGNNERMRDAALVSLLPTIGRTDSLTELGATFARQQLYDTAMRQLSWGSEAPQTVNGSPLWGLVRIDTINPALYTPLGSIWKLPTGLDWQELDFDGPDAYPEVEGGLGARMQKFFNLTSPDPAEERYRRATVLSIRVRYWYELRIPFANWLVFLSWYAGNAATQISGGIGREQVGGGATILGGTGNIDPLGGQGRALTNQKGYATATTREMMVLWGLSRGSIPLMPGAARRFFIPLSATYSMRMQSNFHRKWIMHQNPDWNL